LCWSLLATEAGIYINVEEALLIAFDGYKGLREFFMLQRVEVDKAVATQTKVKIGACGVRIKNLGGGGQLTNHQGQQKHLSKFDYDVSFAGVSVSVVLV
jgi:hypothetical protein